MEALRVQAEIDGARVAVVGAGILVVQILTSLARQAGIIGTGVGVVAIELLGHAFAILAVLLDGTGIIVATAGTGEGLMNAPP